MKKDTSVAFINYISAHSYFICALPRLKHNKREVLSCLPELTSPAAPLL